MEKPISFPSLKSGARAPDKGLVFDSFGEFADYAEKLPVSSRINNGTMSDSWVDNLSYGRAVATTRTGDLSRVPASDKLLEKFEDLISFEASNMATVNAMSGGAPNVGAFLAGSPINMRRRQRVQSPKAPLVVMADLVSSAFYSADQLAKRGAAILAFVRLVSAVRPVTLYLGACTSPSTRKDCEASCVAVRVDTAPLDLARAAYAISGAAFPRQLFYSSIIDTAQCSNTDGLPFPYGDYNAFRRVSNAFWRRFLPLSADAELVVINGLHASDKDQSDPEAWLRRMLNEYGVAADD